VSRAALRLLLSAAPATLALVVVLILLPGGREIALDVYLLLVGGLTILALARATRAAHPPPTTSAFERALRRRSTPPGRPPELARLEREVTLGVSSAFYFDARLRRHLREIADERLREQRGVDIETRPDVAREALGPEAWELVRPDRPRPTDRDAPGVPLAQLESVVATLEGL